MACPGGATRGDRGLGPSLDPGADPVSGAVPWKWTALSSSRQGWGGSAVRRPGSSPRLAPRTHSLMCHRSRLSLPLRACGRAP